MLLPLLLPLLPRLLLLLVLVWRAMALPQLPGLLS